MRMDRDEEGKRGRNHHPATITIEKCCDGKVDNIVSRTAGPLGGERPSALFLVRISTFKLDCDTESLITTWGTLSKSPKTPPAPLPYPSVHTLFTMGQCWFLPQTWRCSRTLYKKLSSGQKVLEHSHL